MTTIQDDIILAQKNLERLQNLLAKFPDVQKTSDDISVYYSSCVNNMTNKYFICFPCGNGENSICELYVYVNTPNGVVYTNPPKFIIGEKVCNRVIPYKCWQSKLLEAGISKQIISSLQEYFDRHVDFINKLAETGITGALFIPEGPGQLKGGFCKIDKEEKNKWQKFAAASATAIVFWFPADATEDIGALDLKAWYKSDRVFIGRDPVNQTTIVDEISKEPKVIISDSIAGLVERVSGWLNRE